MISTPQLATRVRPIIRLFVSSTFSDMRHERNALQKDVFPKLEQLCSRNSFQFQAIDLRWGVSSEAGLDHRTMRICFDELRRAQNISPKPNFLILLGNRYGWRPLPEEITVEEFQKLYVAAGTVGEPAVEVFRKWYRRDENAVPPVYLLQSRLPHPPDWQGCPENVAWVEVQAVLWKIVNSINPPVKLQSRFDGARSDGPPQPIMRFQASATEQEIWQGALRVPDAHEHVVAFFREIADLDAAKDPSKIKDFVDILPSGERDVELWKEQERLKAHLRGRLGQANAFEGRAALRLPRSEDAAADVTTGHIRVLCTDLEIRLTQIIQAQIDEYWQQTKPGSAERSMRELEIEQEEHALAGQERGGAETFVGRDAELTAIHDYLHNDSTRPLVVHGASGCGKTALMFRAAQEAEALKPVLRLIGIHPRCSDIRGLLGSLCQELRLRNPRADSLPTEIKELRDEFTHHLQVATPEQPLIIFLDALDQLSDADGGRLLHWIPQGAFPPDVKLVVSCLSDRAAGDPAGQPFSEFRGRNLPEEHFLNLDALSEAEAKTLLFDRWLHEAGRTVSPDQRERILQRLASPVCRQPIYLKLLFEEVRLWHSYEGPRDLGEGVAAILSQLIERLSRPANHGCLLVERFLGYLAASRRGLAENEILEVLFADSDYKAALDQNTKQNRHELPVSAKRIPIAIWSRLRFDLAPYLTERAAVGANVLTFYHRQVAEWTQEHFAGAIDQTWQLHQRLAGYFLKTLVALPTTPHSELRPGMLSPSRIRCHTELPWQLSKSSDWAGLSKYLVDDRLFVESWLIDASEVKGYWAAIETNSDIRLADAYQHVSAYPEGSECSYPVGMLLFEMGHYEEARQLFETVVEVAKNPQEHGYVLQEEREGETLRSALSVLAAVLRRLNRPDEAAKAYEECEMLSRAARDDVGLARAMAGRGNVLDYNGKYAEALVLYEEAEVLSRAHGLDVTTLLLNQSSCLLSLRRTEEATARCDAALTTARLRGDSELESHAQEGMADIFLNQGRLDEAMLFYKRAKTAFRQLGDHSRLARVLCSQATIHFNAGQFDDAFRLFAEAEATAAKLGTTTNILVTARSGQAEILRSRGQFPRAMDLYQQNERDCRKTGNQGELGRALGGRAAILLAAGELRGALKLIFEWEDICRAIGDEDGLQRAVGNKALVFLQWDRREEALILLKEQEGICERIGERASLARCWGNQAQVHIATAGFELAVALLLKQKKALESLSARHELVVCLHNLCSCCIQTQAFQAALDNLPAYEILCRELLLWPQLVNSLAMQAMAQSAGTPARPNLAAMKAKEALAIARAHGCEAQVQYALKCCEQIERIYSTNEQK